MCPSSGPACQLASLPACQLASLLACQLPIAKIIRQFG